MPTPLATSGQVWRIASLQYPIDADGRSTFSDRRHCASQHVRLTTPNCRGSERVSTNRKIAIAPDNLLAHISRPDGNTSPSLVTSLGYQAGVADIAREAGVAKPTLYAHFGSKENLLLPSCARRSTGSARPILRRSMRYPTGRRTWRRRSWNLRGSWS
ncbi:TetR/AcrR family transcriptional regulator [Mesorhizobium tianshanense]|uniref:TetR/AcrR family transcriptional regulator n=1 Tax=Mesorhizobium tianshanense TaxID=39844 RepID=UPI0011A5D2ED|nr:helix-turn-helix domain-containing protein [Mesorhizobium tianshanense]